MAFSKKCIVDRCSGHCSSLGYCSHHYRLVTNYGVDPQLYDNLLKEQGDVCAICLTNPPNKGLCLDHNHVTNELRAIICHRCNSALGLCDENYQTITRLAEYAKTNGHSIPTRFNCKVGDFKPISSKQENGQIKRIQKAVTTKILCHLCEIGGCLKPAGRKGLCPNHLKQQNWENRPLCIEPECHNKSYRSKRCGFHYEQFMAEARSETCSEKECLKLAKVSGLCRPHYNQKWRNSVKDDPEYKELRRETVQTWRDKNPEKSRENSRNTYKRRKRKNKVES